MSEVEELTDREIERFGESYEINPDTQCVIWKGPFSTTGVPRFSVVRNKVNSSRSAIRLAFDMFRGGEVGPLEKLWPCPRNRCCINPAHTLQAKPAPSTWRSPHCLNGHPYTRKNTIHTSDGRRRCRACQNETNAKKFKELAQELLNEEAW